jgi:2-succinyl-5-enolpyruvyl-6-hydroxy-3-cyclohexene-1-carboxylate synthase
VQVTFAATLFDEWAKLGLTDVVICPGSRSTPLALAAASNKTLNLHVRIDERSAGFFAIGRSLVTKSPVAVIVTSGTAAAELHACVAEADLARVPLILITADRPPELQGVGATQTINQRHLFGTMVRDFVDAGVPVYESRAEWRNIAQRLWQRGATGPVHLNTPFREPLVARSLELPGPIAPPMPTVVPEHAPLGLEEQRVLCVVGAGVAKEVVATCLARHWVVVSDATTQGSLAHADPLLRSDHFAAVMKPDVIVRIGGLPASKFLASRLREWKVRTVGLEFNGSIADPDQIITETHQGLPDNPFAEVASREYFELWRDAANSVEAHLNQRVEWDEVQVARTVTSFANEHLVPLVIGSSMPVRDVEWWAPTRQTEVFANRGANGIDGVVSTVLGVASQSRAVGLVGDITFLHDVSALVDGLGSHGGSCALVVADNGGGGIFSFLSQATEVEHADFESLFGTPRPHDLSKVAAAFGHACMKVSSNEELQNALLRALAEPGLSVIVAEMPSRNSNVEAHAQLNSEIVELAQALA